MFVDQTLSHDTTGRNGTRGCGVSVACSSANGLGFGVCDEGSDLVSTLGRLLRYHHLHYSEASPLVQRCVDCNHPTGGKDVGGNGNDYLHHSVGRSDYCYEGFGWFSRLRKMGH